jgi:hypothetical protein
MLSVPDGALMEPCSRTAPSSPCTDPSLAALLRPRAAEAAPPPGLLFDGELLDNPGPGLQPVKLRGGFARLGAHLMTH